MWSFQTIRVVVSDHTCRVVAYHIVSSDAHCVLVNLLIVFVFVMSLLIIYYMSSKMNKTPMSLYRVHEQHIGAR